MTLSLRNKGTKLYYAGQGRWVDKAAKALGFQTVEDAMLLHHQEHLHDMELVVQHSAPSYKTLVLPIGPRSWGANRWDGF
jgi:hypothetical protein